MIRAHREGFLTSASLMVAEAGFAGAVELARRTPTLGVGLHLAVSYDRALLPDRRSRIWWMLRANSAPTCYALACNTPFRGQHRPTCASRWRRSSSGSRRHDCPGHMWTGTSICTCSSVVLDNLLDLCGDQYGIHRLRIPHEELRGHFAPGGADST